MIVFWLFLAIILFCVYILFGLHITKDAEGITQQILIWVIYTILWGTFINVFTLGYFWSVIREKTGPYGLRGPEGETGGEGIKGECSITATQAYCMKSINDYINNLYKIETNKDILNEETQKFPCVYLNEKIQKMAGSRQYQVIVANLSNENKNIENIVNYLKSIWKEWFDLLYNATNPQGKWFEDEYGDENYEWVGNNPFDEIKKYDIYYWGITRDFRPLKAELCRSTSTYENSKFPKHNYKQEPRLKIIETNNYKFIATDRKTRAYYDASWWRPKHTTFNNETYYPVGDVVIRQHGIVKGGDTQVGDIKWGQRHNNGPDMKTILVAGDVKDPIRKDTLVWHDASYWFGSYKYVCPNDYIDMGNLVVSHKLDGNSPITDKIKCVPKDCVEPINNDGNGLWEHRKRWQFVINNYWQKAKPSGGNGYNLFRTDNSGQPFYKIKDKCLAKPPPPPPPSTKEVEPEFGDLGIGWHGHPYKLDPKYSIFSFLSLVPEGMIVHKGTGQRYYIIHYGGEDINVFNVLTHNKQTNKYDYAIQINANYKEQFKDTKQLNKSNKQLNTSNKQMNTSNKEKFKDNKNNINSFSILNKNGKFISYDTKTNTLSLNKGKELILDIKDNNDNDNNDKYCNIENTYYIENKKKININNSTKKNSILDNNKTKWKFIDNTETGTLKIYNTDNKYLGYNKLKDEIVLVDSNHTNVCDWYLNHL